MVLHDYTRLSNRNQLFGSNYTRTRGRSGNVSAVSGRPADWRTIEQLADSEAVLRWPVYPA